MAEAVEFFGQLAEFSSRIFSTLGLENKVSPWVSGKFPEKRPTGAVLHYTGSGDAYSTSMWFVRADLGSKVSAHVVVGSGWPEGVRDRYAKDLPLVHELPALVIQCVPPDLIAHHATWTNDRSVGLELVNWGEIRWQKELGWVVYPKNWTKRYQSGTGKHPQRALGRYWEPYSDDQVRCAVEMLRWYQRLFGTLRPSWILGHEQVQGAATAGGARDKRDPGPLLPLENMRASVFSDDPVEHASWFQKFRVDPGYMIRIRDGIVLDWYLSQPGAMLGERALDEAQKRFAGAVYELGAGQSWSKAFGAVGKTCLRLLGYYIPDPTNPLLDPDDVEAIRVFQRMVGITGDGRPGYVTRHEVWARMTDRGLL